MNNRCIGILGGGQLGMMLAYPARAMDFKTIVYAEPGDNPAFKAADEVFESAYDDKVALRNFAKAVGNGVITIEFENIPISTLKFLTGIGAVVRPSANCLMVAQNRLAEKGIADELGIPTTPYGDFRQLIGKGGCNPDFTWLLPGVLKTNRSGYDGKGQKKVATVEEAEEAWAEARRVDCILERLVDFEHEISVIVARSESGQTLTFPPVWNIHADGILRETRYEEGLICEAVVQYTTQCALCIAEHLDLVGLLAVEFFVTKNGGVLFNEMAPRPHNSGHWTMDGCETSQYRAHIQAITGKPFSSVHPKATWAHMINIIGEHPWWGDECAGEETYRIYDYGKKEVRSGRKMGHMTRIGNGTAPWNKKQETVGA